jgi:homoserine O-acetyltransferase
MGSWGPGDKDKEKNQPYGLDFPVITIRDMVRAQESLLDHLGIKKLLCATGGSMGGMQLLQFCATFPDKTFSAIPIACSASHSAQNIALNELARQAIMADPVWDNGKYFLKKTQPKNGLAVARMVGHISYLSEQGMQEKFGRKLQEKADYEFSFNADFQVESYLRHQGNTFVERFDANSILYITRAMDYFDLSKQFKGGLVEAFKMQKTKFLVISFSSDWLYTTKENKDIVIALNSSGADVSYSEIVTDKGHDSFLVDEPEFLKTLKGFIDSMYEKFKNEKRI